jgi:glycosyltransferase involved in cell wall biosynthesis
MIFFDVTKSRSVRHRSGLARLSERLRDELGSEAASVTWQEARERATKGDWFVTSELFSENGRPGFSGFLREKRCRTAAIFADAIPITHPQITWPHSVARHPHYLKLLAEFDRVLAISVTSRDVLLGYWRWLGLERTPPLEALQLGADLSSRPRTTERAVAAGATPSLLCVGILEPRKNQWFLLDVCEALWREGVKFELHIVGRVNPHFGQPIVKRIRSLKKQYAGLHYHEAASDELLEMLFGGATATVFPTIAEGCGLPLLESLWHGVPCACSDLPVLRENADGGGCVAATLNDHDAWIAVLRRVLTDQVHQKQLAHEAMTRSLPTWKQTAEALKAGLRL